MKFKLGEPKYPFEGKIRSIWIPGQRGKDIEVLQVTMEEMSKLHDRLPHMRAMPAYYAHDDFNNVIWFHPNPHGEYEFIVKAERTSPAAPLVLPKKATA